MTESIQAADAEVLVPLDEKAARLLDGRIRRLTGSAVGQLETVGQLLDEAQAGGIHMMLGFKSWPEYVADAVGKQLDELSSSARKPLVALMSKAGMSVRGIAAATGASKSTVHRDLVEVSPDGTPQSFRATHPEGPSLRDGQHLGPWTAPTPVADQIAEELATVTGIDGKSYPKGAPTPKPKRRPLTAQSATAGRDLVKAAERIERIIADDRFEANKDAVASDLRGHLTMTLEKCQQMLDRLPATEVRP